MGQCSLPAEREILGVLPDAILAAGRWRRRFSGPFLRLPVAQAYTPCQPGIEHPVAERHSTVHKIVLVG